MKNQIIRKPFLALIAGAFFMLDAGFSQPIKKLDELVLKGTHNSYACCGSDGFFSGWDNSCPVMHNPPYEQMDNWNAWAFELDFSVKLVNGNPTLIIGHDGSTGDDTFSTPDWGVTVEDYLISMRDSRSSEYRPFIVKFEQKPDWGDNNYDPPANWGPLLDAVLLEVFGTDNIFGPNSLAAYGWLTVPQLAGKIIPYANGPSYGSAWVFDYEPLPRFGSDSYTNENEWIAAATSGNYKIMSGDNYQEDWTFDFVAPPNPMYIKSGAPFLNPVVNQYGHDCGDFNDAGNLFIVFPKGTFRFPYDDVLDGVEKAEPGWTLLIHTGTYPENITINKPLTLKADGGTVVIGGQ